MDAKQPLQKLYNTKNPLTRISKLEGRTSVKPTQPLGALGEVTELTGDLIVDRLILPSTSALDLEPSSTDFTGVFAAGDGVTFGNYTLPMTLGGVEAGVVKAGFDINGDFIGGGGSVVINEDGISLPYGDIATGDVTLNSAENLIINNMGLYSSTSSWTYGTGSSTDAAWRDVIWSSMLSLFIASGYEQVGSTDKTIMYSTDGIAWTSTTDTPQTYVSSWNSLAESTSLGIIVAVNDYQSTDLDKIATSTDGLTWTARQVPSPGATPVQSFYDVIWCEDLTRFVVVGAHAAGGTQDNMFLYSADGLTWSAGTQTIVASSDISSSDQIVFLEVAYSTDLQIFSAVGSRGALQGITAYSTDGIAWADTSDTVGAAYPIGSVSYSPTLGKFVAGRASSDLASSDSLFLTSTDGQAWAITSATYGSVGYNNVVSLDWISQLGRFYASVYNSAGTSDNYTSVLSSTDGVSWTQEVVVDPSNSWSALAYSETLGRMVAVNKDVPSAMYKSFDGTLGNILDDLNGKIIKYTQLTSPANGKVSVSVASNDLTVSLVTNAGTSATSTNPIYMDIGGTIYEINKSLSVTKNDGTNWFNAGAAELAAKAIDYFVYLIYNSNAGVVDIGFSRIPYGRTYADFSATTTNELYLAYGNATAPASADVVENIGRFTATLSAAASYNWSISGTGNVISKPTYETDWLTWLPTYGGFASSDAPTDTGRYKVGMNIMKVQLNTSSSISNATTFTFTLPLSTSAQHVREYMIKYRDNSVNATTVGRATVSASSNSVSLFTNMTTGAWTNANTKAVFGFNAEFLI